MNRVVTEEAFDDWEIVARMVACEELYSSI